MFNTSANLLLQSAVKYKDNIAIVDQNSSYTYKQYCDASLSIGTAILNSQKNCLDKVCIGVYLKKSCNTLLAFMGILFSGNTYVPLDVNMPKSRLNKIIENLQPEFIITDEQHSKNLNLPVGKLLYFDNLLHTNINRNLVNTKLDKILDIDPIYIMYTSGSTGMPKGVVIPHKGVIDYAYWVKETFLVDEYTIIGNQAPFHFDNSVLDIYTSIISGSKLVIIPEIFFNYPTKLPEYINENNINFIFWVPTVLINIANSNILDSIKMPNLKKVLFCGEVMPNKQLNIWRKTHENIFYANLYGPTEITDVCTYYIVDEDFKDNDPLPIGKSCKNMDILILNQKNKKCKINEIGELCILGTGLSLGYYKDKEKSDKAFIQNPLNDKYREYIYKTGDLVYKNEKEQLIYVGRVDSQIKHKGNRIELGEIETAAKALKHLENACVLYDDENSEIVLIGQSNLDVTKQQLLKDLRGCLPSYMVPTKVIILDKIPLNANGKLDRVYLKEFIRGKEA